MSEQDPRFGSESENRRYIARERRSFASTPAEVVPVRLTRKYADEVDGVSLAGRNVGDRLPLEQRDAELLMAEGWADAAPPRERQRRADEMSRGNVAERTRGGGNER